MLAPIEGQPAFPGFELGVSNGPFIRRGRIAAATRELAPGDKDELFPSSNSIAARWSVSQGHQRVIPIWTSTTTA